VPIESERIDPQHNRTVEQATNFRATGADQHYAAVPMQGTDQCQHVFADTGWLFAVGNETHRRAQELPARFEKALRVGCWL
jgi:hypothetical protein